MTATLSPEKSITHTTNGSALPPQYLWTREKYEQAVALGLLGPDDKVELIEGEIVQKMPQNDPHRSGIGAMQEALSEVFPNGYWLCIQLPIALDDLSKPEPDLAVVFGSWRDYLDSAPTADRAALIVEMSDGSLLYDQTQKASMYARAGIADYWIVNLNERILEVRRQPAPQDNAPYGYEFGEVLRLTEADAVAPLAAVSTRIRVADLLP